MICAISVEDYEERGFNRSLVAAAVATVVTVAAAAVAFAGAFACALAAGAFAVVLASAIAACAVTYKVACRAFVAAGFGAACAVASPFAWRAAVFAVTIVIAVFAWAGVCAWWAFMAACSGAACAFACDGAWRALMAAFVFAACALAVACAAASVAWSWFRAFAAVAVAIFKLEPLCIDVSVLCNQIEVCAVPAYEEPTVACHVRSYCSGARSELLIKLAAASALATPEVEGYCYAVAWSAAIEVFAVAVIFDASAAARSRTLSDALAEEFVDRCDYIVVFCDVGV